MNLKKLDIVNICMDIEDINLVKYIALLRVCSRRGKGSFGFVCVSMTISWKNSNSSCL